MKKLLILILLLLTIPVQGGVVFDGVDDIVTCPIVSISDNITISMWIKAATITPAYQVLISPTSLSSANYSLYLETTGRVATWMGGGSSRTANGKISIGKWQHVAMTLVSSGAIIFYVDGVSLPAAGSLVLTPGILTTKIGCAQATSYPFSGTISQVAIWQAVRTPAEILTLSKTRAGRLPKRIDPANLKLYLPLDDAPTNVTANGKTFYDLSGNGYNGTGSGGWAWPNAPKAKVTP